MSVVRLGDLVDIKGGGTPSKDVEAYWGGDIPWASVKDFRSSEISTTIDCITADGVANSATNLIPAFSILVPTRMAVGKAAINTVPMAINQDVKALTPRKGVDLRYLLHALLAKAPDLEKQATGATVKGITLEVLKSLEIPLPPLDEQKRIAAILDQADELRRKRQRALDRLRQLEQAVFEEMFGRQITDIKQREFHELEAVMSAPLQNGAYFPREEYADDGIEMVHMSDAFYSVVKRGTLKRVRCPSAEQKKYSLLPSDILIARRSLNLSGAAKPCLVPDAGEPLIFESSFIRLRPDLGKVLTRYLFTYLSNSRVRARFVDPFITQSTISGINQSNLAKVKILLPPTAEQQIFCNRVESADTLQDQIRSHASALDALFASLQHRAFLGKFTGLSLQEAAA